MHVIQIQISDDDYYELVVQLATGGPCREPRGQDLVFKMDKPRVTVQAIQSYAGSFLAQSVKDQEQVFMSVEQDDLGTPVQHCPHCGAGPADAAGELPHFRNCQDA